VFLVFLREPPSHAEQSKPEKRPGLAHMWEIVQTDLNFRQYLIARFWTMIGSMATGFITVYAVQTWQAPDSTVGRFTAALLLGQTAGNLMAGVVADRLGHKLPLLIGSVAQVSAMIWALLARTADGMYLVYFLLGMHAGIHVVCGLLVSMEFASSDRRPSYAGIANTAVGVGSIVAPLLGGWIATAGYPPLFAASACAALIGLMWLALAVRDPRRVSVQAQAAGEAG
jgi:MFS family permease